MKWRQVMPTLTWRLFITYYLDIMLSEYGKFELKPNGDGWAYGRNQLRVYESNRVFSGTIADFLLKAYSPMKVWLDGVLRAFL